MVCVVDNVLRRLALTHELLRRLVWWHLRLSARNIRVSRHLLPIQPLVGHGCMV